MEVEALKEEFRMLGASKVPPWAGFEEMAVPEDGFLEGKAVELLLEAAAAVAPASAPIMLPDDIEEGLLKEALLGIRASPALGLREETLCASAEGLSAFACVVKEGAFEGRRPPSKLLFRVSSEEGLCELEAEICCCAREGLEELVVVGAKNVEFLCDVLPSKDDALGKRVSVVGLDEALLEAGPIWSLASPGGAIVVLIRGAVEFFLDVVEALLTRDA